MQNLRCPSKHKFVYFKVMYGNTAVVARPASHSWRGPSPWLHVVGIMVISLELMHQTLSNGCFHLHCMVICTVFTWMPATSSRAITSSHCNWQLQVRVSPRTPPARRRQLAAWPCTVCSLKPCTTSVVASGVLCAPVPGTDCCSSMHIDR